jgi:hypothetical protein
MSTRTENVRAQDFPNGGGAAALLAAGIGSLMVAIFKSLMIFYKPTGPLSGVTTCAILAWLICWAILHRRWSSRMVALGGITTAALILLGLSLLLTFPPIADLL